MKKFKKKYQMDFLQKWGSIHNKKCHKNANFLAFSDLKFMRIFRILEDFFFQKECKKCDFSCVLYRNVSAKLKNTKKEYVQKRLCTRNFLKEKSQP